MVVEAQGVAKSFGTFQALKDFNLNIKPGECFGLLGPNGAGKSTFISLLYGARERTAGQLRIFGEDPAQGKKVLRELKKRIGVVTQENALDEGLTILENMQIYGSFLGLSATESERRTLELLEEFSLMNKQHAIIRTLSGGMKRRLVFVRALLGKPELLILDEPTTGLDPAVRAALWSKVKQIKATGTTILLTTHYMSEAEVLSDRITIMNHGQAIADGTPTQLIEKHSPGYKALFAKPALQPLLAVVGPAFEVLDKGDSVLVSAAEFKQLLELQNNIPFTALQLRPSNLEDVFLKLTGEELHPNA